MALDLLLAASITKLFVSLELTPRAVGDVAYSATTVSNQANLRAAYTSDPTEKATSIRWRGSKMRLYKLALPIIAISVCMYYINRMSQRDIQITISGWRCLRCGHEWVPRSKDKPRSCANPKCRSVYWDRPRKGARLNV